MDDEEESVDDEEESTEDDEEDSKITIPKQALPDLIDFLSDVSMMYGVDKSAKAHAEHSQANTFYYR